MEFGRESSPRRAAVLDIFRPARNENRQSDNNNLAAKSDETEAGGGRTV